MELTHVDLDGPVHYVDSGEPHASAPVAVLVHGLGASHLSWHPFVPLLARTHRVIALDLAGFGHSAPLGRGTAVGDNRDLLARFVREVVGSPVALIGNSMGGMVSILTTHAHPSLVDRLVLVDPALPGLLGPGSLKSVDRGLALHFLLYNTPLVGEAFLRLRRRRLTPAEQVADLLDTVCSDPSKVPRDTVSLLVSLATARRRYDWSDKAFLAAERSIIRQVTLGRTAYLAAIDGLRIPTLLVHGEDDRLVDVSTARAIAPRNPVIDLVTLPGVGHAPQLEVPAQLDELIGRWLTGVEQGVA
jgi:pimeloyl-ACP methyl ester carboxylesterase